MNDVNRRISEWFEPMESLPAIVWTKPASSSFPARASVMAGEKSPKGAWKIGPGMKWKHLDYFASEEANAKLRAAIRAEFPYVSVTYEETFIEFEWSGAPGGLTFTTRTADEKTAWVHAFCRFAGIDGGEHDQ